MESKVIDFGNPSNFDFDDQKITVIEKKMQLRNIFDKTFIQDFSSDTGFTFNAARTEFTGGKMQQLDQGGGNYIGDTITLPLFNDTGIIEYTSFVVLATNDPHLTLNNLWFDGAAWVASNNSFAESNLAIEIAENINSFPISDTLDIKIITVSGTSQMSMDNITIGYKIQTLYPTNSPFADSLILINMFQPSIFSPDSEEPPNTELRWTMNSMNKFMNYNTAENIWEEVLGDFVTSNTMDEIQNNLPFLRIGNQQPQSFTFRVFFTSTDGSATPKI